MASEEANWSGSALFVIKYVNLYQKSGSSNLIGWKLEVGVASKFIQHDKGLTSISPFYYLLMCLKTSGWVAKSLTQDQMLHSALLTPVCPNS